MLRIIDGELFEGKPSAHRWNVSLHDFGNGHREATVQRAVDWEHLGATHKLDAVGNVLAPRELTDDELQEKRDANAKRAARRATSNVRRRCKAQGLDTLLTLTYRFNQTDQAVCEQHLHYFLKLMRKAFREAGFGDFCYVACFEPQKRGAWHVHLATHKLPHVLSASNGVKVKSFNVIRAIWRRVVGDLGGNIDVGRWKSQSRKSAAKCAAYISKYVMKMFAEGLDHSKRFRASRCDIPKPVRLEFLHENFADLIQRVMVEFGCENGQCVASAWLAPFGDIFFCATEPPR